MTKHPRVSPSDLLALAAVIAAAVVIVVAQPIRSSWVGYADADGTYVASSINLVGGHGTKYLDHPGLPTQEILATIFGIRFLADGGSFADSVDRSLLDLDSTRPYYRSLAVFFYLVGTALLFAIFRRRLGHWTWGLAGGLIWLAAPGLVTDSIQARPDVLLSVLCAGVGYVIVRAAELRDPARFFGAAVLLGIATMEKLQAAGLVVPLVLAAIWRAPSPGWWNRFSADARSFVIRHRLWLLIAAAAWVAWIIALNRGTLLFRPTTAQTEALVAIAATIVAAFAVTLLAQRFAVRQFVRRGLDPFYAVLLSALVIGVAIPVSLDPRDGVQAIVLVALALTGRGVNADVPRFATGLDEFTHAPLNVTLVIFGLALIAAVVAVARRKPAPVLWATGALVLAVMAEARLGSAAYFAPAFVVALPPALWILREGRGKPTPRAVWPLVALLVVPLFYRELRSEGPTTPTILCEQRSERMAESVRRPGEVVLTNRYWGIPDSLYFELVQQYVNYTPVYPYHYLPASEQALEYAAEHGLRPAYYLGPSPLQRKKGELVGRVAVGDLGAFRARPVGDQSQCRRSIRLLKLVAGPRVAR